MNSRKTVLICFTCFALLSFVGAILSSYAIPVDYSVTNNFHGINTPFGSTVIVTATTTDSTVFNVTFLWHQPVTNTTLFTDVVPVTFNGVNYTATSTHIVLYSGNWGVQALFQSPTGTTKEGVNNVTETKATSFEVSSPPRTVPEVPLGPLTAIGSVGAAFGFFYLFKKNRLHIPKQ